MTTGSGASEDEPPVLPRTDDVAAWHLAATLAGAGVVAGLLIVTVYRATQPAIVAHKAEVLRGAIQEVLEAPARYDTLYLVDGALVSNLPAGVDPRRLEQIYRGYDDEGHAVGYAIAAGEPGFQDMVRLIFGYDPVQGTLLGMKVLESKETPGLGDKIEKDSTFAVQFDGARPPLEGVKSTTANGGDPHEIDMITGATISSRTVIQIINHALERLEPALAAYGREGAQP